MLPKRAKRTAEENEDEMASRLHLDIGKRETSDKGSDVHDQQQDQQNE
jgi:hypothetical protein